VIPVTVIGRQPSKERDAKGIYDKPRGDNVPTRGLYLSPFEQRRVHNGPDAAKHAVYFYFSTDALATDTRSVKVDNDNDDNEAENKHFM